MPEDAYITCLMQLKAIVPVIARMPLREFIETINRTETLAPILHPSLYMKGADNLNNLKKLAIELESVKNLALKLGVKDDPIS